MDIEEMFAFCSAKKDWEYQIIEDDIVIFESNSIEEFIKYISLFGQRGYQIFYKNY